MTELMLEIGGSLPERMSHQKVRHQDQIFLGNSEVDPVCAVTTQSCRGTISSAGLSAYQSQLSCTRQEGADSHPLPHKATTFPWIMPFPILTLCGEAPSANPSQMRVCPRLPCWQTKVSAHASILHTQKETMTVPVAVLADLLSV